MIRALVMIAIAGFVLCVASLSAAVAIGGPEAIAHGGWSFASGRWDDPDDWDWDWNDHDHNSGSAADGPQATRTIPWTGGDSLDIFLDADVRYIQSDGAVTVTATGSRRAVDRLVIDNGRIHFNRRLHQRRPLEIVVRAPSVTRFDLGGRSKLTIEDYRQDRLSLDVSGMAEVRATGEAAALDLDVSGMGEADLAGLRTKGADVDVSGGAEATVAPSDWARLDVSGGAEVTLTTRPMKLETDISGGGEVNQPEASPGPSPSARSSAEART